MQDHPIETECVYLGYFQDYLHIYLSPKPDKRSSPGKRCRLANDLQDQQQAEWLDGDSIKSYNDLAADIRERVTEFPGILVQNHESQHRPVQNFIMMEVLTAIQLSVFVYVYSRICIFDCG